ncbi:MAG: O-antigen ligase family protein [Marinosulfonomonas sp.]
MKHSKESQLGSIFSRSLRAEPVPKLISHSSEFVKTNRLVSIVCITFLFSLIIPLNFSLGSFRISPYRFVLLVAFIPLCFSWLTGGCGRVRLPDVFLLLFCIWSMIAVAVNTGASAFSFSAINVVETFGTYLLARCAIRNLDDFLRFGKVVFIILLILIPFAMMEGVTKTPIYLEMFKAFGNTIHATNSDIRLGLRRAQSAFEHPILFGVFASTSFSLLIYAPRKNKPGIVGLRRGWVAVVATFFSLSSGAFIPVVVQSGLMLWNRILGKVAWRWWLLAALIVSAFIAIDLVSSRNPFRVFADYLVFNRGNSYWRVLIFNYGIQNVWDHPLFGYGTDGGWVRPSWMVTASVDNFWLVMAMRYGIPGFVFFSAAYISVIVSLIRAKIPSQVENNQRYALVFSIVSTVIAISTVWLWNATYTYLLFLLGASAWLSDLRSTRSVPTHQDVEELGQEGTRKRTSELRWSRGQTPEISGTQARGLSTKPPREKIRYSRVVPGSSDHVSYKRNSDEGH